MKELRTYPQKRFWLSTEQVFAKGLLIFDGKLSVGV